MIRIVSLLAFGDSIISLALLDQARSEGAEFQIIGTGITQQVAQLFRDPLPVDQILPSKAAFNTIKERGPRAAWADWLLARRALRQRCLPGDLLVFERDDYRNRLLVPKGCKADYAGASGNVYQDRRDQARALFGGFASTWPTVGRPDSEPRRVMINPCARYRRRHLQPAIMENVLALCARRNWAVTLVDPSLEYAGYRERVANYLPTPELSAAADELRHSDLYIGPDSFFIHLAYFFQVPHFGFFYPDHLVFQTPGMAALGGWASFEDAADPLRLAARMDAYLSPGELPPTRDGGLI